MTPMFSIPLKFLREREIVHFQRFGEALSIIQSKLDCNNYYLYNPEFDKKLQLYQEIIMPI